MSWTRRITLERKDRRPYRDRTAEVDLHPIAKRLHAPEQPKPPQIAHLIAMGAKLGAPGVTIRAQPGMTLRLERHINMHATTWRGPATLATALCVARSPLAACGASGQTNPTRTPRRQSRGSSTPIPVRARMRVSPRAEAKHLLFANPVTGAPPVLT